jgi:formylglycine-generating enzyme required for sulfatase activity
MLANKQWVERKALGNRLAETIERLLASNPDIARPLASAPKTEPAAPPPRSKRPLVIGAGVLAICVLLAGGLFAWKAEQDRAAREQATLAQAATQRAAQERAAQERAAQERAAQERAVQERAAQERAAQERAAQERAAQEKAAQERAAQEKAAQERAAQEQAAKAAGGIARGAPSRSQIFSGKPYLFQECDVCPVMAAIPAGSNLIGSPEYEVGRNKSEGPQQEVVIAQPFAVGRTEVSFTEWLACVAEGGCNSFKPGDQGWGYGLRPAINISWADARAYAEWLSRKTGAQYRLLSEAEWEYAARGCVTICRSTPFWFGMDISRDRANYDTRYAYERGPKASLLGRTVETTSSEPNPFGLLHVHGNVSEWVDDCWNPTLDRLPKDGSARMSGDCQTHVIRGGSWQDEPKELRSAARTWLLATDRSGEVGFRVARILAP